MADITFYFFSWAGEFIASDKLQLGTSLWIWWFKI